MIVNKKGITLISLVITIIILLILAGVTIAQLTGNGLFENAKLARQKYKNAQEKEQSVLDEYEKLLNGDKLPENTPDTEAGTLVALKDGWGTQTVKYFKTSDGTEVTGLETVSTVYAVSVGNGETVPIPNGFYYVGGNFDTGVIISDNETDKYDGKTDKTTHDYATSLVGNQFVWIPCTTTEYKNCNVWDGIKQYYNSSSDKSLANGNWDTTTPSSELLQIEKYGGFYVGRYEAGLDTSKAHTTDTAWESLIHDKETDKPQSKASLLPWNWVSWNTAKVRAEEMYNNNYVRTGLITGTQWDVMINKIATKENVSLTNPTTWGNYYDTSVAYRGPGATHNSDTNISLGIFTGNGGITNSDSKTLLYTGASEACKKYNIYDLAGNLWEMTEENAIYSTTEQYTIQRGGSYWDKISNYQVAFRCATAVDYGHSHVGFRVVLYIK